MDKSHQEIAQEYLSVLLLRKEGWAVESRPKPDASGNVVEKITARSLDILGLGPDVDKFLQDLAPDADVRSLSFHQLLDLLLVSLRDDIAQCLSDDENHFFQSVHLHFLPTGLSNACCVNSDTNANPLGYFIAFLNEGLYFSLHQLFTALLFEELQGGLASFQRDGRDAFEAAIVLYLNPSPENIRALQHDVGDVDASGEIGAHITSATSLLLQFITLHEFAHAWLGHHQIIESQRLSMTAQVGSSKKNTESKIMRELEFQADEFAFRALMKRTKSIQSQWAHCFAIYLFFCYLKILEDRIGTHLSDLHPPPLMRANRLREILKSTFPNDAHLESDLDRIDTMILKWTS